MFWVSGSCSLDHGGFVLFCPKLCLQKGSSQGKSLKRDDKQNNLDSDTMSLCCHFNPSIPRGWRWAPWVLSDTSWTLYVFYMHKELFHHLITSRSIFILILTNKRNACYQQIRKLMFLVLFLFSYFVQDAPNNFSNSDVCTCTFFASYVSYRFQNDSGATF